MKNKNLQDLFNKVMQEEKNEIRPLDEQSAEMIKGGTAGSADDDSGCVINCSKIKN